MQFTHDGKAVERHSRRQIRRERQACKLLMKLAGLGLGQFIDAYDLRCQIVVAAALIRFGDE